MFRSMLILLIISGTSMKVSYATDSDEIKRGFLPPSFSRQEEKSPDLDEINPNEQETINQVEHHDQPMDNLILKKFQEIADSLYNLWKDPFGFGSLVDGLDFT